ncbi:group XV phospholipase a2 [Plakobranchus ocellatus]|uniref:Group XV phospholipase a2 n=1 Tax=Plakobranchus ocellatus TaxID=259542 RepID=A0AAV4CUU1_9GAST|nr:group XV phospholipase a2 [Plakobranchus ocellatus]
MNKRNAVAVVLIVRVQTKYAESGHSCDKSRFSWPEKVCELVDNLPEMECPVKDEVKHSLVYIAGYVTRKDDVWEENEDTLNYFDKFGALEQIETGVV